MYEKTNNLHWKLLSTEINFITTTTDDKNQS